MRVLPVLGAVRLPLTPSRRRSNLGYAKTADRASGKYVLRCKNESPFAARSISGKLPSEGWAQTEEMSMVREWRFVTVGFVFLFLGAIIVGVL